MPECKTCGVPYGTSGPCTSDDLMHTYSRQEVAELERRRLVYVGRNPLTGVRRYALRGDDCLM